jgi:hypothetical protein
MKDIVDPVQPSGFFMLTRGMMSVLSSLFFFCLGSGADYTSRQQTCPEHHDYNSEKTQTFLVLLNVEATK